jgi:L-alanine-DL-glutamate epimerase-like enolase superfamily enzyme
MNCRILPIELKLRREFAIAGEKVSTKRNFIFVIEGKGIGEAAGSIHYGASPEKIENDLMQIATNLTVCTPDEVPEYLNHSVGSYCLPAICAVSTAWHDWKSKEKEIPLFKWLRLQPPQNVKTSVTASIGDIDTIHELSRSGHNKIKVKLDADDTYIEPLVKAINDSESLSVRVDANGSWTYDYAVKLLEALPIDKVELIEQPFPCDHTDDWKSLQKTTKIPLIMDESVKTADDVERVAGYVDGVNVKIQKSGRLETAVEAMQMARELNLKVMLGCMIESSAGIAASCHLSSLADYHDLDGRLLVVDDPFCGLIYDCGYLKISGSYGHGVSFA